MTMEIADWMRRHGLDKFTILTAGDILAAREADHAEALHEQIGRNEVARIEQVVAWRARHGLRQTSQHRHWAVAIERDHAEAIVNEVRRATLTRRARLLQVAKWMQRHEMTVLTPALIALAVEADRDEAMLEYAMRLVRP